MRAKGALLAFYRYTAETIEGVFAKVKYATELRETIADDGDLSTWWFNDEWMDQLSNDLDQVHVTARQGDKAA